MNPHPQIRILTDSGCDIEHSLRERHNIEVVPLKIRFGTTEYEDGVTISIEEFYEMMASSSELPATAAPSQGAFEEAFRKQAAQGAKDIVCVNLSYQLSATGQAAVAAAEAVREEVRVHTFDSATVSCGLGTIVLEAARAVENGRSVEEVKSLVDDLTQRTRLFGVMDTLENLQKGGRIGRASALLGSALSIKPILEIKNGEVLEFQKPRTRKRAFGLLLEQLKKDRQEFGEISLLALGHGFADDFEAFRAVMEAEFPVTEATHVGATIGTHAGPGLIGMSYVVGAANPLAQGGRAQGE